MNIYKITVSSDMSADHEYRVASKAGIIEFVNAQFEDRPNIPSLGTKLIIEIIPPYRQMENGSMEDNPDWKT